MNLRLYRIPHVGEDQPNVARLLFEARVDPLQGVEGCRDFYLYVWIRDGRYLQGFQAVMDDEYVLTHTNETRPSFGSIGREPFNRAIIDSKLITKRKKLLRIVRDLRNDDFPRLLHLVGKRARGVKDCGLELVEREREVLVALLGRSG